MNDESIISCFEAQKSKQELPLSLTFKLRSEGQLKLQGDLSFRRGRKGRTWKKQLLYYRTEHTEDRQQSAVSQMNIFESILTPPDFQRRTTGPIFFSLFLLWEPFVSSELKTHTDCLTHGTKLCFFSSPFLPQPPLDSSLPKYFSDRKRTAGVGGWMKLLLNW